MTAQDPESLLLKDYDPVSVYRIPRSMIDKPAFPVIDMHSHPYVQSAEELSQWAATMDELGIQKTIILTGATGQAFDSILNFYGQYPRHFELWCGIDFSNSQDDDWADRAILELERCHAAGAKGVGEITDKGMGLYSSRYSASEGLRIHDEAMSRVLARMAELKMPINIHMAEPIWMYEDMDRHNDGLMNAWTWRINRERDGIVLHDGLMAQFEKALQLNPGTTFIACHFLNCSYDLSILGKLLDNYPNLYADISARYAETAPIPRYMAQFYEKYQDRLLYGTDMGFEPEMYRVTFRILESNDEHFYENSQFGYHWALHGLALPGHILQKVYWENAAKLIDK